jgi:hypothetical protein
LKMQDGDVITTTEDHPFYNLTDRQWQRADELDRGDLLKTPDGSQVRVARLDTHTPKVTRAYNLSVEGIHTYYVLAGNTPVLVHNTGPCDGDEDGIDHAKNRHLKNGPEWDEQAGYFDDDVDFADLARGTAGQLGIYQKDYGTIKYVINAGRTVGYSQGKPTNFYTVIRDPYSGDLVTMFPGIG